MGCDIHFFVERKSQQLRRQESINKLIGIDEQLNTEWESADKWIPNKYYDGVDETNKFEINRSERFYSGRNYALFGILAGVRWQPDCGEISKPKGFPNDASDDVISAYKSWGRDAHSASYFTLKELQDVDWNGKYKKYLNDISAFMATMEKMAQIDPDPENVRCIFWFDN